MGESGRRSTLVSRLPIFRRSNSKRQDSLPSSPSSGGLTNGVHTSSPSSTNSSSGSTGKRRSLFRAPSLGFSSKRNSDPRDQNSSITTSVSTTGFSEGGGRSKNRHSFGFGSHKQKKITRSQTEDFDKASSSSSSAGNRNPFINCISGSGVNEGDDSGFLDDFSGASNNNKRSSSSRQKKQLLPKSFSAHHRFSKSSDHHRPPEVALEPPSSTTVTPGSWPGELMGESSVQSPMISEDRTTAITPSEFHPITEDSVSDSVDALPTPSPVPNNNTAITTSQVFFSPVESCTEKVLPADTSTANNTDYETAVSLSEPETAVPCLPLKEQTTLSLTISPSLLLLSPGSLCSSVSPYHGVMRLERRLRSSSEGAGGPHLHGNLRDVPGLEGCGLIKHRHNSSSSKLGSLDVLNNLGSSELDEDDLMLDLELSDDQRHRHGIQSCTLVSLITFVPRYLFQSTETSPASSLQSLPISPCSEKSLPFKVNRTSLTLPLQLKFRIGALESSRAALKMKDCQMSDRTTQTEHTGPEVSVVSSSVESLTQSASLSVGARRADSHPPVSQIPRAVGSSASSSLHSLHSRGSVSSSDHSSPPPPTPSSSSSSSSSFTGRLGQPPRGPLSLHSYSRKNVFLQHSLQTSELQALTQRDS
uniref:Uncharacterized protein n=1 Tax=Periophthalmus magnuspinnatus TaxID=409849 RepID=A0A3B4AX74_9GOBI